MRKRVIITIRNNNNNSSFFRYNKYLACKNTNAICTRRVTCIYEKYIFHRCYSESLNLVTIEIKKLKNFFKYI